MIPVPMLSIHDATNFFFALSYPSTAIPLNSISIILPSEPGICIFPVWSLMRYRPSITDLVTEVPEDSLGGDSGFIHHFEVYDQVPTIPCMRFCGSTGFVISSHIA